MGTTAQLSDQITNSQASPDVKNSVSLAHGKVRYAYFNFAQSGAGDAGSTVDLVALPPGRIRIIPGLSIISNSAFGASRVLDIGTKAYTKLDGTTQAASANALKNDLDVSAAAIGGLQVAAAADPTLEIVSQGGVTINATVAGGTIPDAATLKGYIAYIAD